VGLDELHDFDRGVLDVCHVFAVGVLSEERGCTDDDISGRVSAFAGAKEMRTYTPSTPVSTAILASSM
jgi:hypothetical protein